MDTIGLLATYVGVISLLLAAFIAFLIKLFMPTSLSWWATTSLQRAERRINVLIAGLEICDTPTIAHLADLISLYGGMILNLIGAVSLVIVSIEILDLGPALLASVLPFHFDAKLLTRISGLLLLFGSYFFIFRLVFLGVRISAQTTPRQAGYKRQALREIASLRNSFNLAREAGPDKQSELQSLQIHPERW